MDSQFIYGRRKTGYRQLVDLDDGRYTDEDLSSFQHLWNYELAEGCDRGSRPECRSFYVTETSAGLVAQIGRTALVPAGTSRESGDRDTTLLHKYLYSGEEYENLLEHPEEIFKERYYCETVEEALGDRVEKQLSVPETEEDSIEELLQYFGMEVEVARDFLYTVLDSLGKMDSRVYIALRDWNAEGTSKALSLCKRILGCLPPFWVSACGFLTYSSTFHNSQTNMIPRTVKIIFFPNNAENIRRYDSVGVMNYIIDGKNKPLKKVEMDKYTREMLDVFTDCFLHGKRDQYWYTAFQKLKGAIRSDALLAPENLSCAYFFKDLCKQLNQQNWFTDAGKNEMYYIVETFLGCNAFATEQGRTMEEDFLKECVKVLPVKEILLSILCDYYMLEPYFREWVVDWICWKLTDSEGDGDFNFILNYSYEDPQLGQAIKERIYQDARFYPAALHREKLGYLKFLEEVEDWEERIDALYSRCDELAERYPAFLDYEDTMSVINDYVGSLCYDDHKKAFKISMKDLGVLYRRDCRFREEHEGFEGLFELKPILRDGILDESWLDQMADEEIEQLAGWIEDAVNDLDIQGQDRQIEYIRGQMELIDGAALLKGEDGDACVCFLEKIDNKQAHRILSQQELNVRDLAKRMRFQEEEKYLKFYKQLYFAREADQDEILSLIMEEEGEGLGGITGLAKFWNTIENELRNRGKDKRSKLKMQMAVERYYEERKITSADIKKMKKIKDFVAFIEVGSYMKEDSIIDKLKNLAGRFGRRTKKRKAEPKQSRKKDKRHDPETSLEEEQSYEEERLRENEEFQENQEKERSHELKNSLGNEDVLSQNSGMEKNEEKGKIREVKSLSEIEMKELPEIGEKEPSEKEIEKYVKKDKV